jgi:hypothetical protein
MAARPGLQYRRPFAVAVACGQPHPVRQRVADAQQFRVAQPQHDDHRVARGVNLGQRKSQRREYRVNDAEQQPVGLKQPERARYAQQQPQPGPIWQPVWQRGSRSIGACYDPQ